MPGGWLGPPAVFLEGMTMTTDEIKLAIDDLVTGLLGDGASIRDIVTQLLAAADDHTLASQTQAMRGDG
jgi:hypothetical protein